MVKTQPTKPTPPKGRHFFPLWSKRLDKLNMPALESGRPEMTPTGESNPEDGEGRELQLTADFLGTVEDADGDAMTVYRLPNGTIFGHKTWERGRFRPQGHVLSTEFTFEVACRVGRLLRRLEGSA